MKYREKIMEINKEMNQNIHKKHRWKFFAERYKEFLKDEKIVDYIKNFVYVENKKEKNIRVNTLKVTIEEFEKRLKDAKVELRKIDWLDFGYYAKASFALGATIEFLQGLYYIQSLASQYVVKVLSPKPYSLVLDMASAPGGKTSLIAQYMNNTGMIIALEKHSHRFESLKANLQRLNVKNTIVLFQDATNFRFDEKFDYILVDAPCSGNFYSDKDWFNKRSLKEIKEKSKLQIKMLKHAIELLKKDGILVYSTCSLEPEENEYVIDQILDFDVKLIPIEKPLERMDALNLDLKHKEISKYCTRFWPHIHNTDGFFICKMMKK